VLRTAEETSNGAKHPDTVNQEMLKDCLGSGAAPQEIKKQPFAEIPWPMSGDQSIAAAAGLNLHRQLRPKSGPPVNIAVRPFPDR